jgi:hypothetical protein
MPGNQDGRLDVLLGNSKIWRWLSSFKEFSRHVNEDYHLLLTATTASFWTEALGMAKRVMDIGC